MRENCVIANVRRARRQQGFTLQRGFTLIELLIVMAIILVIAAIAVPQLGKQLMAAHENAVVQTIRTLHADEAQYYSQFQTYATSLAQLGPPASGAAGPAGRRSDSQGSGGGPFERLRLDALPARPPATRSARFRRRSAGLGSRTFYLRSDHGDPQ